MNNNRAFWDARAADPSLDANQVTHSDTWQRWLEIESIKKILPRGLQVIDIGCGAGFATKQLAALADSILGVDFSAGMIERACSGDEPLPSNVRFKRADVLALDLDDTYDVALTIRCLINLENWDVQQRALANIARIVRPGGLYIFVEGLVEGRANLNKLRQSVGLESMPVVWHNCDFERDRTLQFLAQYFSLEQEIGFGSYDLVARVVHPLLVAPSQPKYEAAINEVAARVALHRPTDTEHSRVAFYCLRRHVA